MNKNSWCCWLPILLLVFSYSCSGSQKTAMSSSPPDIPASFDGSEKGDTTPAVVSRSVELSTDVRLLVDELASGMKARGIGECLMLEIAGLKAGGRTDVAVHVFLNLPDADPETPTEIPNFVGYIGLGFGADPEKGADYVFDLDSVVEKLGGLGLIDQNRPDLEVTLVGFSLASDTRDLAPIALDVANVAITSNCD